MQTCYFGYFGHAFLHTPKMIVSTCRRLWCLSVCKKTNFIIHFILEILQFQESCNFTGCSNLRTRILPDIYEIGDEISRTILLSILDYFEEKLKTNFEKKFKENLFWSNFGQKWIFLEKRALSVLRYSNYLSLCKKSEKTLEQFLRKTPNWWTDRKQWFYRALRRWYALTPVLAPNLIRKYLFYNCYYSN